MINDVAQLRHQVHQILTVLTAEQERLPAAWFWPTMTDQERHDQHSELLDWVESVLSKQYPDYLAERIRSCWPNHPEARWELAWLYQLWSAAYLAGRPAPKDAADWHDRWCPGVIHRLTALIEPMRRNVYMAANHHLKMAGSHFSRFSYYTVTSLSDHLHAYHTITAVVAIIMIEKNA